MQDSREGDRNTQSFDQGYFEEYQSRKGFSRPGDKPYLFRYWRRYILEHSVHHDRLLDAGCGLGYFLLRSSRDFKEVHGIDYSDYAIQQAKGMLPKASLNVGSVEKLDFSESFFDAVVSFDVVEHLPKPETFFSEADRVLRPGGLFLFSTPNPSSWGRKIKGSEWFGYRDKTHCSIRSIGEWRQLAEASGFDLVRDGTDMLWDVPYVKFVPAKLQWFLMISLTWILVWLHGCYRWQIGENYYCVLRKKGDLKNQS